MLAIAIIRIRKESKTKDLRNDLAEDFINIDGEKSLQPYESVSLQI
jgi:hypothetical protein